MNKSSRLLITAAAVAGLYTGALASKSYAANANAGSAASKDEKKAMEKHGCKGQNGCAGHGGCKSGDNGCKGKNTCKGKGGCSTMEKPKEEKKS